MSIGAERVKQAKVQNLRAELDLLSMGETKLLNDFCMKLYGLVTNIRVLGETVDETSVVKKLLRAVHSKYVTITSTIEQFGNMEEMMVEDIVGPLEAHDERTRGVVEDKGGKLLMTEEEWLRSESPDGKLLLTREEWVKPANRGGSDQRFRRESSGGIRGGRDHSKMRSITPQLKPETEKKAESSLWYLDNGASNHMTGLRSKFYELDKAVTGRVKFGDGSVVHIKGKGSMAFKCKNGEKHILREVYYIPSPCSNIISLGQL
ncbi:uncharacterized protein LOC141674824 [Apium graveolens]|uniref:uncharacterized protein LOC141674824 n=1 Tax=Apium graveolens TaxID=4045 RepID=UPI003D7BDEF6